MGKRIFRLRVVRAEGGLVGIGQAIGRSFAYLLSLPFFVGFLWAAFDRRHRTFHDKLAGTEVVRDPP